MKGINMEMDEINALLYVPEEWLESYVPIEYSEYKKVRQRINVTPEEIAQNFEVSNEPKNDDLKQLKSAYKNLIKKVNDLYHFEILLYPDADDIFVIHDDMEQAYEYTKIIDEHQKDIWVAIPTPNALKYLNTNSFIFVTYYF
jgi:hypothetical protein